jgi:hypothetical protein
MLANVVMNGASHSGDPGETRVYLTSGSSSTLRS